MASSVNNRMDVDYDPARDVWWRVTERDGETIFDTSPDGLAWNERMRTAAELSFARVDIALGAGTYPVVPPNPGQARCN
ncbi:MAG TPA: hypothetical protein VL326_16690 [Kofleriaceae bacterium]|nr:hypothetical protein [Kofleriaceae bacterium]